LLFFLKLVFIFTIIETYLVIKVNITMFTIYSHLNLANSGKKMFFSVYKIARKNIFWQNGQNKEFTEFYCNFGNFSYWDIIFELFDSIIIFHIKHFFSPIS
jgi:hypothetical protein